MFHSVLPPSVYGLFFLFDVKKPFKKCVRSEGGRGYPRKCAKTYRREAGTLIFRGVRCVSNVANFEFIEINNIIKWLEGLIN